MGCSQAAYCTRFGSMGMYYIRPKLPDDLSEPEVCPVVTQGIQLAVHLPDIDRMQVEPPEDEFGTLLGIISHTSYQHGFKLGIYIFSEVGSVVRRAAQIEAVYDTKDSRHYSLKLSSYKIGINQQSIPAKVRISSKRKRMPLDRVGFYGLLYLPGFAHGGDRRISARLSVNPPERAIKPHVAIRKHI
ncbi:unnamed protein product [Sphagnum jensenii]|uniref:Uncharacterized protein n=1 Tax=Sphagnum jensenii TaxID=128206 RepID=A0ABP0ZY49_9BRYO